MGEVLKAWFRDRLGIMIDLSSDVFGPTTQDGTLLAQLLHSYDIIDNAQLNTIISTEDPALARVNLRHLRLWLKFIGVDCDDDTIEDISNGKGTTAIRLFYKIFVSLENKDKLHFITQQKEREKYIPNSSKFDVITILERPPTPEPSDHPLAVRLIKNASVIAWHRDKFKQILDRCKHAREQCLTKLSQSSALENKISASIVETDRQVRVNHVSQLVEKEMKELQDFSKRHEISSGEKYTYQDLCNEKNIGENIEPAPIDPDAAKKYVKCMKDRTRRASTIHSCKNRMEKSLTTKLWEKQIDEQEKEFDSTIANKIFTQSQYEKQMMIKLCEIRDQKRRFAKNRRIVDKLIQEKTEAEHNMELAREHETIIKEEIDIEAECLRLCELHKRIGEQKILNSQKKHYNICMEVLNDLIDISLEAADYREANNNNIPLKIWSEWKALFIKNQSISNPIEYVERLTDSEDNDNKEEILRAEKERQEVLNESDFDNYHNVGPPWVEFIPDIDLETREILRLGIIVLGYIVNRLLKYTNSSESSSQPLSLRKVATACILLGVLDTSVYPIIQSLLNHRGIKVIRMEDGINYCLQCYKEEIKDFSYTELNISTSNDEMEAKKISSNESPRVNKKKDINIENRKTLLKAEETTRSIGIDEETQTPRTFPNDEMLPNLSNAAYLGELINELFNSGQQIPNELNSKIIIEYIKSLIGIKGWVLIDYPNTFNQMALLEEALTGLKIPLEENNSDDDLDYDTEMPNLIVTNKLYRKDNEDESSSLKESRLVCNPIKKDIGNTFNSYMSGYIRALTKPRNMEIDEPDIYEILAEDATKMDTFYTNHGLAHALYYTSFDLFTLKRLCRLVIGDKPSIRRIPSVELFGDALNLLEDKKDGPLSSKAPVIKQLVPHSTLTESDWGEESEYEGEDNKSVSTVLSVINIESVIPKPGEDDWDWLNLAQPSMLLKALGTQWKNIENIYIEKLKEIFFIKRINYAKILPYNNYVTKHMSEFIKRPDTTKQDMLHIFQTKYNDIEKDMRDDFDVKCELHCRVSDFREELWQICDERRKQSEEERQRIINQDWTSEEMIVLTNLYISIIETEMYRCIDTVQLIQDYYTSMLQKPISQIYFPKYSLQRLELNSLKSVTSASTLSPGKINKPATKETSSLKNSKKISNKMLVEVPTIDCSNIRRQITDLMISDEIEPSDVENLICIEAIRMNILFVKNIVDSLASSVFENLKKEELLLTPDNKGKIKIPSKNIENLPTTINDATIMEEITRRGIDLCLEWKSALKFEISRISFRLKLLDKAAQSDVASFYETMKNCFNNILKEINDRYKREIKSVNDMGSLFCFAIEDGISIKEELSLDGDRFIVKSNVLMYAEDLSLVNKPIATNISEGILPSEFRMGQLGRLMDIFRYVAPHGSLEERIFTYIIEDMITFGEMEGGMTCLPNSWYKIKASQVSELVYDIFGDSEYIDWREFIIYAMDIPMPNEEEILDMRSEFISIDRNLTETVTREEFHSVKMWFTNIHLKDNNNDNDDDDDDDDRHLLYLHENNEKDEEEMYDNELEDYHQMNKMNKLNNDNIMEKNLLKNCKKRSFKYDKNSLTNSSYSLTSSQNIYSRETVRLMLAKELLCDMFISGCDKVNYTSFILSLSKSNDPREGLGKALSLAVGKKVCVSYEYGEEYVKKLINNNNEEKLKINKRGIIIDEEDIYREKYSSNTMNEVLKKNFEYSEDEVTRADSETTSSISQRNIRIESEDLDSKKENFTINNTNNKDETELKIGINSVNLQSEEYKSSNNLSSRSGTIRSEISMNKSSPSTITESNSIAYWIPRDICLTVLIASLPWHARQPNILETKSCLRECLEKVYDDIQDIEISNDQNYILSHRFVNHHFILNLINSTTAFTSKNIGNIVEKFF